MNEILLNIESKQLRCATLKNGKLTDLILERKKDRQLTGNIYRGKVKNLLDNIQSAFVDINEGDNGFIHISDILDNMEKFIELYELDFDMDDQKKSSNAKKIEQLLQVDQPVLVQVVKEPIGSKGARLTSNISIAGRYLVLLPNSTHRGVSRKIEDRHSRDRLKKLIRAFEMPQDMGLICRTSSATVPDAALIEEAQELFNHWEDIQKKFQASDSPTLLYAESNLIKRALIKAVDKQYERILVDHYPTFQTLKRMYTKLAYEHPLKIEFYRDKLPMFERFNVEREIEKALRRKIWLPSGGYLYFEKTEAMYTVDVNSGRSNSSEDNVEESLVRINLEAAQEIARQLRLRNIGGLVICDFIDMRLRKNQRRVLEKLKECLQEDRAKCTVLSMSEFGLVEMTRQRSRGSLFHTMFTECQYCMGSGMIKNHESVSIELERALRKVIHVRQEFAFKIVIHPVFYSYLEKYDLAYLKNLGETLNAHIHFDTDDTLHLNDFKFYSTINGEEIEV